MRAFLLISHGYTTYKIKDFYKAGRLDIAIHSIIHAFFISNGLRSDVEFNLLLLGPPKPPIRIKIVSNLETPWSKKDIGSLIKISLWKFYKKKEKPIEALKGVYVERKGLEEILNEYKKRNFKIFLLDLDGKNIEDVEIDENSLFVLGDFVGIDKKQLEICKNFSNEIISLGKTLYFTSQCIFLLNYFYDKKFGSKYFDTTFKFKSNI
ncbi:MAG: hypothetical protein QXW35_03725 [Candidatus Aenigmatarchaeota archaeon]